MKKLFFLISIPALWILLFTSCKKDVASPNKGTLTKEENSTESNRRKHIIIVHRDHSIQAAVDAADQGYIIKIERGVYKEAIHIDKPGIQLVGADDHVVIQNPGDEENGVTVSENGDGFILKNVTIRDFEKNGLFMIRVDNFLLSHVTTINNGEYGLFPLFCTNGVVEHCSATGHSDTGIYIGQSSQIELKFNRAFANVNGLEIENCSNVVATKNLSYNNVAGILVVLLPGLTTKSSSQITISHNYVYNNNHINFAEAGGGFEAFVPSGSGILVVGTDQTTVEHNIVAGNNFVGIATVSTVILGSLAGLPPEAFADIEPNPDGTSVTSNVLRLNGSAPPAGIPLPGVDILWDGSGTNNCWKNNNYNSSFPASLPVCN